LREAVAPQAQILDRQPEALKIALQGMGDRALLGLRIPQRWGGAELREIDFRHFQMMVARYSGALAFLQTQHQSASSLLVASSNHSLQQHYLPQMARGELLVGVGFSQLRRRGEPLMQAIPVPDGYQLDGEVPWIAGLGLFSEFVIGAQLPSGEAVYGVLPLHNAVQDSGGTLHCSQVMQLAAMNSTNTVRAKLHKWFLPRDRVVAVKPPGAIHDNDRKNVLHHGFFALGCAQAGLDILEAACHQKRLSFLQKAWDTLNQELSRCRQAMLGALSPETDSFERRLQLRAWAISLAGRCTQGAVVASGGAANSQEHPAQRVYRETLLFAVAGQTTAVMEATLQQLLSE
jgi:alkylation response protein AidB-like acyl-CoA dehydrogenase